MIALDASALLALLFREPGHAQVAAVFNTCVMSTLNLSEVLSRFARDGHEVLPLLRCLEATSIQWISFDSAQAAIAAQLLPKTRAHGLSLGDRACLALGLAKNIPVLTAVKAWKHLDVNVDVRLIR